jgi:hypothetical protein
MLFRVVGYAFIGWILWKFGKKAYLNYLEQSTPETATASYAQAPNYINMTRCHYCGLNVPTFEVVTKDGKKYCCKEHAKLAQRDEM